MELGDAFFFSSFGPEKMKQLVEEAGFEFIETEVETQLEGGTEIPYLWMLAQKG
jgi:hypothetical protein